MSFEWAVAVILPFAYFLLEPFWDRFAGLLWELAILPRLSKLSDKIINPGEKS